MFALALLGFGLLLTVTAGAGCVRSTVSAALSVVGSVVRGAGL